MRDTSAAPCRPSQRRQIVARKPSQADRRVTALALDRKRPHGLHRTRAAARTTAIAGSLGRAQRQRANRDRQRHDHDRAHAGAAAPDSGRVSTAQPSSRRYRLGRLAGTARSMRRNMAGTSASRRWSPKSARSSSASFDARPRALLDRRDRRRAGRLDIPGQGVRRRREAAPAAGRQQARGLGLGRALTEQCVRFAREAATHRSRCGPRASCVAAREIYRRAGFRRVGEASAHRSFGSRSGRRDLGAEAVRAGATPSRPWLRPPQISSSRGMISTKLQGRVR